MNTDVVTEEMKACLIRFYDAGYVAMPQDFAEMVVIQRLRKMELVVEVSPGGDFGLTDTALFYIEGYPGVDGTGLLPGSKSSIHAAIRHLCVNSIIGKLYGNDDCWQQLHEEFGDHKDLIEKIWCWTQLMQSVSGTSADDAVILTRAKAA